MSEATKFLLLGEDDMDDQEMLREVFTSLDGDFHLHFVNTGREVLSALSAYGDTLPCLIVLDYNMPGMNGAEILREINENEHWKKIPKIMWSTSGSEKFKKICMELGALDYVIKPSNIRELEGIAKYMLSVCNG